MNIRTVEKILGGRKTLHKSIQTKMDMVDLSAKGVTKEALLHLADYLKLSIHQMAGILPVTERTIQRYSLRKPFSLIVSEHILQIAEVAARGAEAFGSRERFLAWMDTPSTSLAGKTPLSLFSSKFGAEMVLDELGRIEHGVLS